MKNSIPVLLLSASPYISAANAELPKERHVMTCKTARHTVVLDKLDGDGLRYRSWNRGSDLKGKPDLLLVGGSEDSEGIKACTSYIFYFKSGIFTYTVSTLGSQGCTDTGGPDYAHGRLMVEKKGQTIGDWWCVD